MKHRYFEKISRKSITVCGLYPPPIGGVSIHIQRVIDYLTQAYNKVTCFNIEKRSFLPAYLLKLLGHCIKKRPHIIHYHGTYLRTMIFDLVILWILSWVLKFELLIIEHDCRHLNNRTRFTKKIFKKIVASSRVVLIGSSAYEHYEANNILPQSYSVESAFLPPVQYTESLVVSTYPSSLQCFIEDHTPVLLFNAAHIMLIKNKDVYGFDQAIDLVASLKTQYPDVGLLMVVANINNQSYFAELYEKMKHLKAAENIYVLQDQKELWPLFKKVDLFIRPTLSDGSSISVEEALFFNVPVVASDVVLRPENATVYQSENIQDFVTKVDKALQEQVYGSQAKRNYLHQKSS